MAALTAVYQIEFEEKNRELLSLLKTMEAAEEAEDRQEKGGTEADSSGSSAMAARNNSSDSASGAIQKAVVSFTVNSMRHAGGVDEAIAGLNDEGHQSLDMADSVTRGFLHESAGIRAALEDDSFTDEEIATMMKDFQEKMPHVYENIESYRSRGLQNLQDAQELKI